ncbi:MAG: hypothetical protein COY66_06505 [Candidatus Kerfeldbacteria bacterium CG_4_10_14_0_8_um_filter_42_10]|uniref:Uncharacterized protein n=1 Tax=Candidatus Kerfeldbacteria bacterium CG_4_10_14_0_8_um_filter_42_10 TaxID=2014248 RepID=A0A2M7RFQ6_9BACT|nr:MAG: hypothetical protein COY66_06505 [Candidatus Kerfeldbacteria bacterium CG_4_10_14_0_8_um_filter_42_10]
MKLTICAVIVSIALLCVFVAVAINGDDLENALCAYSYLISGAVLTGLISMLIFKNWALTIACANIALIGVSGYTWMVLFCLETTEVTVQRFVSLLICTLVSTASTASLAWIYKTEAKLKSIASPFLVLLLHFLLLHAVLTTFFLLILATKTATPIENSSADPVFWVRFFRIDNRSTFR